MLYKSLIYSTKYGKDYGRWATFEAKDYKDAVKKCDAMVTHLCHGRKDAIAYTKPITI